MTTPAINTPRCLPMLLGLGLLVPATALAARCHLQNELICADFDDTGLTRLSIPDSSAVLDLASDTAALTVDGARLALAGVKPTGTQQQKDGVTYTYTFGDKHLKVIYELKPAWHGSL